jgi:hypothetical protein
MIDGSRWKTTWETAISRHNKKAERVSYVRVRPQPHHPDELLITTLPSRKLNQVSVEEALARLGQAILSIAPCPVSCDDEGRFRPINTSQDWALPRGQPSKWVPVLKLATQDREEVVTWLAREGVSPEPERPRARLDPDQPVWDVVWRFPGWNPGASCLRQLSC